ncbi:MAG: VOC family protein [Halobacteriovoraceae bacterium]|nr:VOC family protein [Halobacteriovoraceae bacterium]
MIENALDFLKNSFRTVYQNKLDLKTWEIDHLCYRTVSDQNYIEVKNKFLELGSLLTETIVRGRPIAIIKLSEPIFFDQYIIDLIEIPSPKKNSTFSEGFEHFEVVIDCHFQEFVQKYPHIKFDLSSLSKTLNPELKLDFETFQIKLHHKSLEHIINIEKNKNIMNFLCDTDILNVFRNFHPCLSGTIPLGIDTSCSDLDILFQASQFEEFLRLVQIHFSTFPGFCIRKNIHQNKESLIVNFKYNNLLIELFTQDYPVYNQRSNLHFLVEGRLLKIFGKNLSKKIIDLKSGGLKTEPAFGHIFNLKNSYDELENLAYYSDMDLYSKLFSEYSGQLAT